MRPGELKEMRVGNHTVEFYYWGDEITPAVYVSVVEEKRWLFFSWNVVLHRESLRLPDIEFIGYRETAESVVRRYKGRKAKLESEEWL